jgi:tRNA dimethylallyltransferase
MALPLIAIAGPTAAGKTALSLFLAERLGGAILSCDSVQLYRSMDIGTAKVTAEERSRVRHFGLDLSEPDQPYDVCRFSDYARRVVDERSANPLFCVGGSGFYLKTFYGPVCDPIAIPQNIRQWVRGIEAEEGLPGLLRELRSRGNGELPVDERNPRRVARLLERTVASGLPPTVLLENFRRMEGNFGDRKKFTILLEASGPDYEERLRRRGEAMVAAGLLDETAELRRKNFERNPSACGAVCYREALEHLDGRISREEMLERIFIRNRQLARKQRSWFRRQIPADVLLPGGEEHWSKALDLVSRRLDRKED